MCAVNGVYSYHCAAPPVDRAEVLRTRDSMISRGPDAAGLWASSDHRLALAHRRLKIIDLTEAGGQPMVSQCGRFVLCFNGEIYNYRELRDDLRDRGAVFRSASDTEVLLTLLIRDGAQALTRARGMYALALWDDCRRRLTLARDPFGIKPLYVANDGWQLRFASQVKALIAGGQISTRPEPAGQAGFLLTGSVPEPFTMYQQVRALPAGHYQVCDDQGPQPPVPLSRPNPAKRSVGVLPTSVDQSGSSSSSLKDALADSLKAHLVADVPVGLFLSSGIDSAVLAAMAKSINPAIRCLTLGFEEYRGTASDEVDLATRIAAALGVNHQVRYYTKAEFEQDFSTVLEAMDQPSIDGFNTWLIAGACRKVGLKTALSGLGADELFAGYPSFTDVPTWRSRMAFGRWLPGLGSLIRMGMQPLCEALNISPKAAGMLEYGSTLGGAYLLKRGLYMPWELAPLMGKEAARQGLRRLGMVTALNRHAAGTDSDLAKVSRLEQNFYMKNQLLRDADWAGMSHSVEIRVPFVDIKLQATVGGAQFSKLDLLNTAAELLPDELAQRSKTGFTTPLDSWRGYPGAGWARHWARDLACRY
ncbi:MAG: asparagine synthase (glutamine-hydrolyzing) [Lysobacterales bacterium]